MKNRAVQLMMAQQYNVCNEEVGVEFLHVVGCEYTFKVIIDLPEDIPSSHTHKELIVTVSQQVHMGDDYNEKYLCNH